MKNYKTLIIDAMNLAYKMYFRLPKLTDKKGNDSSTVYGFLSKLNALYNKYQPSNVVLCWDSRNSLRRQIDLGYKKREKPDDESFQQFIKQVVSLKKYLPEIGIPSVEVDGLESDDIMAILANRKELKPVVIVTTDNDLYQVLGKDVVIDDGKMLIDEKVLSVMYHFAPRIYTVYKAIVGCASDKVKGVGGYGNMRAYKLLKECDFDFSKIFKKIDSLGIGYEFNYALNLVVLPFNMNYDVPMEVKQMSIDRKKLANFLIGYDIYNIDVWNFMERKEG